MENFSTTGAALLPRATNLATLAVVVAATWWSGAQRPSAQPQIGVSQAGVVAGVAAQDSTQVAPQAATTASPGTAAPSSSTALWTATTTIAREGLQAVSFQTRPQR